MGNSDGAIRLSLFGPFGVDFVSQAGDLPHGSQGEDELPFLDGQPGGIITAIFKAT
jgi:hypothetical protein